MSSQLLYVGLFRAAELQNVQKAALVGGLLCVKIHTIMKSVLKTVSLTQNNLQVV